MTKFKQFKLPLCLSTMPWILSDCDTWMNMIDHLHALVILHLKKENTTRYEAIFYKWQTLCRPSIGSSFYHFKAYCSTRPQNGQTICEKFQGGKGSKVIFHEGWLIDMLLARTVHELSTSLFFSLIHILITENFYLHLIWCFEQKYVTSLDLY